jgi:preprotein translocase subunit YajC
MELLLPLILLVPLLLITMRARKQQRTFSQLQASLVPGQAVVTTSGLHGTIHAIDGDVVVLDVADGVQLRWSRAGIGQVLKQEGVVADNSFGDDSERLGGPALSRDADATVDPDGRRGA